MPSWDEVYSSDKYKSLSIDEKEYVRNAYFDDFIAPQVPEEDLESVRESYDNDTLRTLLSDDLRANNGDRITDEEVDDIVSQKLQERAKQPTPDSRVKNYQKAGNSETIAQQAAGFDERLEKKLQDRHGSRMGAKVRGDIDAVGFKENQDYRDAVTPIERRWIEALGDTALQVVAGTQTLAGMPFNLVAPDSKPAEFFRKSAGFYRSKQSESLLHRIEAANRKIDAADEDGIIAQAVVAAKEYFKDPGLASKFIFENLPMMVPSLTSVKLAEAAALAKGLSASTSATVGLGAGAGTNAILNAGGARGDAYDDLKNTLINKGYSKKEAERIAKDESVASGLVGGAIGLATGATGFESAITGVAKKGVLEAGKRGLIEFIGEEGEEVLPKFTTNIAASKYDNRKYGKDIGRTIAETAVASAPTTAISSIPQSDKKPRIQDIIEAKDVDEAINTANEVVDSPEQASDKDIGIKDSTEKYKANIANNLGNLRDGDRIAFGDEEITYTRKEGDEPVFVTASGKPLPKSMTARILSADEINIVRDDEEDLFNRIVDLEIKEESYGLNDKERAELDSLVDRYNKVSNNNISAGESFAAESTELEQEESQTPREEDSSFKRIAELELKEQEYGLAPEEQDELDRLVGDDVSIMHKNELDEYGDQDGTQTYVRDADMDAQSDQGQGNELQRGVSDSGVAEIESGTGLDRPSGSPAYDSGEAALVSRTNLADKDVKLPKTLSGAKPRYSYQSKRFDLDFESDIDKAAYISAQKVQSKRDKEYVSFVMQNAGMTEAQVRDHGLKVRERIKGMAKGAEPGVLRVADVYKSGLQQPDSLHVESAANTLERDAYGARETITSLPSEVSATIFGMSGAQLEAMQGGKLSGKEQFPGIARSDEEIAQRKQLVKQRKEKQMADVERAAKADARIDALRQAGVEESILLTAEREAKDGDDSLIRDLARIQGVTLPSTTEQSSHADKATSTETPSGQPADKFADIDAQDEATRQDMLQYVGGRSRDDNDLNAVLDRLPDPMTQEPFTMNTSRVAMAVMNNPSASQETKARAELMYNQATRGIAPNTDQPAATPQGEPLPSTEVAKLKQKVATRLTPIENADDLVHIKGDLRLLAQETGWAERGGRMVRGSDDFSHPDYNKISRTKWIPKHDWFSGMSNKMEGKAATDAVEKALGGKPMTAKEKRFVLELAEISREEKKLRQEAADNHFYDSIVDLTEGYEDDGYAAAEREAIMAEAEALLESIPDDHLDALLDIAFSGKGVTDENLDAFLNGESGGAVEAVVTEGQDEGIGQSGQEAREAEESPFDLTGQTPEEIKAEEQARADREKEEKEAADKAEAEAKKKRIAAEVASRQQASAENFQLGQSAEDALAGQGNLFNQQAPKKPTETDERGGFKRVNEQTLARTERIGDRRYQFNIREAGNPNKTFRVTMSVLFDGGITGAPSVEVGIFKSLDEAVAAADEKQAAMTGAQKAPDSEKQPAASTETLAGQPAANYKAGDRITADKDVFEGDIVTFEGKQWMAKVKRGARIPLLPFVDGKPIVSADTVRKPSVNDYEVIHTGTNYYGYGGQPKPAAITRDLNDKQEGETKFSRAPSFVSPLTKAIKSAKQETMPAAQWALWLDANKGKLGLKEDELTYSGIRDYLTLRGKDKVTKAEIADYLSGNGVKVEDVVKGEPTEEEVRTYLRNNNMDGDYAGMSFAEIMADIDEDEMRAAMPASTKFSDYWESSYKGGIPGTYREILVTLPRKRDGRKKVFDKYRPEIEALRAKANDFDLRQEEREAANDAWQSLMAKRDAEADRVSREEDVGFRSGHWDEKDVLVHVRLDELTGAGGKRYVRVGEVQSDFGQAFKKQKDAIKKAVDTDFQGIVDRMKSAGVLMVEC